jgi:hypothetical protein
VPAFSGLQAHAGPSVLLPAQPSQRPPIETQASAHDFQRECQLILDISVHAIVLSWREPKLILVTAGAGRLNP